MNQLAIRFLGDVLTYVFVGLKVVTADGWKAEKEGYWLLGWKRESNKRVPSKESLIVLGRKNRIIFFFGESESFFFF